MNIRKLKKVAAAWKEAMQQDLDRFEELKFKGDWTSEEFNRLNQVLRSATDYLIKKYGICTTFSGGRVVYMEIVDRLGCRVAL